MNANRIQTKIKIFTIHDVIDCKCLTFITFQKQKRKRNTLIGNKKKKQHLKQSKLGFIIAIIMIYKIILIIVWKCIMDE